MEDTRWKEISDRIDAEENPTAAVVAPAAVEPAAAPVVEEPAKPAEPEVVPAAVVEPAKDEPKPAVEVEPATTAAVEEPQRDEKGRFVKLNVHVREVSQLKAELAAAKDELARSKEKPVVKSIESLDKLSAVFQEKFPAEFGEFLETVKSELLTRDEQNQKLKETLDAIEKREQEEADAKAAKVVDEVNDAIVGNKTLATWHEKAFADKATDEDRMLWDKAVEHDKILKTSPAWRDATLADRFKEAVKRTSQDFKITTTTETPAAAPAAATTLPAAPKTLPAQATVPSSLSNMPGGISPRDTAQVETANPLALMKMTEGWTDKQVDDYFARQRA